MSPLPLALLALLAAAPDQQPAVHVSPGSQIVLEIPGLERVAVGDPEVADVTPAGSASLIVLGRKQGQTSLTVWTRGRKPTTRTVIVDDGRLAALAAAIKEKVNPSLETDVVNEKLLVDGQLDSVEEYGRLRTLVGDDPDVKLMVRLNPQVLPAVAKTITSELRKNGIETVEASVFGQRIVLEGSVADPEELKRAQLIADSLYKDLMH